MCGAPLARCTASRERGKIVVTELLTFVTGLGTYRPTSPMIRRARAGRLWCAAEVSGARGRLCNPLPGDIGHQLAGTTTGARGAIAGLGQVGAGNRPLDGQAKPVRRVPGSLAWR
jgi:hypothetical protein